MAQIDLSQEDLKLIVGLILQLQFKLADAKVVLPLIERLDALIEKPPVVKADANHVDEKKLEVPSN